MSKNKNEKQNLVNENSDDESFNEDVINEDIINEDIINDEVDDEEEDSEEEIETNYDDEEEEENNEDNYDEESSIDDNESINLDTNDDLDENTSEINLSNMSNILYTNKLLNNIDSKNVKEKLNMSKKTLPLITKFEFSKIKSIRVTQLSNNSNPFIETDLDDIEKIADEEIKQMKLPFIIKRNLPNGNYELWKLSELAVR